MQIYNHLWSIFTAYLSLVICEGVNWHAETSKCRLLTTADVVEKACSKGWTFHLKVSNQDLPNVSVDTKIQHSV